jgi:hypothetical protein
MRVGFLVFCAVLSLTRVGPAAVISATFSADYTAQEIAAAQAAIDEWQSMIQDNYTFANVQFEIGTDVGGGLAGTLVGTVPEPILGSEKPAGPGPVVDPWDPSVLIRIQLNTNYVSQMSFDAGSPPDPTKYDALTIFRHELGHGLGIDEWYADFSAKLTDGPGANRTYSGSDFSVVFTGSPSSHIADASYPGDLMVPTLGIGVRRDISQIDLRILTDAFGYTVPEPGDANGDGVVDAFDYLALKANFGMPSGATWAQGDFDRDGNVDRDDLHLLAENFGQGTSHSLALGGVAGVPEPATLLLISVGSAGLLARARRRRAA